ncbi:hypothetical protein D9613_013008 [Agrocybe pediades]|uniref:Ankyrin repeat protein n=1 Tax=Agrocybe pediades TaxID=84607 RepID=A0A8H4QQV9_9AGAR|nr:hypothetical protein D9613_013008 [Agrocybe pediades]
MAQNIWDDACRNTLHKPGRLERYLQADPNCINQVGGLESLTPLAGACNHGHLDVVTLLLDNGARPDAPCPNGRTALYWAITQAPRHKVALVKALLAAPHGAANPNEVYPDDGNVNALQLAIEEAQDKAVVQALVDGGAIPTDDNKKQAKTRKMDQSLKPLKRMVGTFAEMAAAAVSIIIAYTDGGAFNGIAKGVLSKMYKITAPAKNPIAVDIPEPKTAKDFKKTINNFVNDTGLARFYTKKPDFIQALAEKASALRDNPNTDLGKPSNIKRLTNLSLYQLVIYCDDSGSMGAESNGKYPASDPSKTRYHSLCQLVSRITSVATTLLPDDTVIKVRFINNPYQGDLTAAEVPAFMETVRPGNTTPLGRSLVQKILKPLVYDRISNPAYEFEQPLLIFAITDGEPDKNDVPIADAVTECRRALVDKQYDPTSVMFCISQIGTDAKAKAFLDNVRQQGEIEDVVYCTAEQLDVAFSEYRQNEKELDVWLLDMLTRPIMRAAVA